MPQVAVAAAAWIGNAIVVAGSAVGLGSVAGAVGAAAANFVAGLGFAAGIGGALASWGTVAAVASLLNKPKIGGLGDGGGTQVDFKANPNAGVPLVLGRTGTGGVIVHMNTEGQAHKNAHLLICTVLTAGPMQGVDLFLANNQTVFTSPPVGDSVATTGPYAGAMDMRIQAGVKPSGAVPVQHTAARHPAGVDGRQQALRPGCGLVGAELQPDHLSERRAEADLGGQGASGLRSPPRQHLSRRLGLAALG
jgi:hypothetical protein